MDNIRPIERMEVSHQPSKLIKLYDFDKDKKVAKARAKYGVHKYDTYNLSTYLPKVIANALRILISESHGGLDLEAAELCAAKLEFYATEASDVVFDNIDWSKDSEDDILEYINSTDRSRWPGQEEYSIKTDQIEYWQDQYLQEALDWLAKHWGHLWD